MCHKLHQQLFVVRQSEHKQKTHPKHILFTHVASLPSQQGCLMGYLSL